MQIPDSNHLSAVLLARRRQMTLVRCHFAHRANFVANRWFDVGPAPVAQQEAHGPHRSPVKTVQINKRI